MYSKLFWNKYNVSKYACLLTQSSRYQPLVATYTTQKDSSQESKWAGRRNVLGIAAAVGLGSSFLFWGKHASIEAKKSEEDDHVEFGGRQPSLQNFTADEVSKHNSEETGIWISYKHGVYDITKFVKQHPGGSQAIMLGAGSSVEPFWSLYAIHQKPHVLKILENYRVGNLVEDDVETSKNKDDPFASDPKRHKLLKPSSVKPFNAEPPLHLLPENLLTPNEFFYVRNHLPVPELDEKDYELEIEGVGLKMKSFSLKDLKKFPKYTVTAAIQCGGNRRSEMAKVKIVKGLNWGQAAISNAEWSGARLSDVLASVGVKPDTKARHVQFEGADCDVTGNPYGASIPFEKALNPLGDVILAYEMNGKELPKDHGYPIRVVATGIVGARSVKWLSKIVVSEEESPSHWQQNDYKGFGPNVDWDTVDFSKSPAIQDTPVTSAICWPQEGNTVKVKDGMINVKGYAYSGGGRKIIRVDVSPDGGKTWMQAENLESDAAEAPRAWGWTLWSGRIKVPKGLKELELVSKAVDSSYNTQPENFDNIWNLRGVLSHAYHRVRVKIQSN